MKYYWLYSMECVPTQEIYIGCTKQPNPAYRWAIHFQQLRRGKSNCRRLQEVWNNYPDWTYWRFSTLDRISGKVNAGKKEAELILEISEDKRLNLYSPNVISLATRKKVKEMLAKSERYIDIRAATGVSLGQISKIKNRW